MSEPKLTALKPVRIIHDHPVTETSVFGFDAYARTLAGLIADKDNATPLVIGVYGPWGSGKTTLMQTIRSYLSDGAFSNSAALRPCKTVWFQAWKYAGQDEILAALIRVVLEAIKQDRSFLTRLNGHIERAVAKTDVLDAATELAKQFIGMDVGYFLKNLPHKGKMAFYDTFSEFFNRLVWTYTRLRPKFTSAEQPDDTKGALVVFIDDLDRCPGDRIVKVLETIKLFMDKRGCVFVIGAAEHIIQAALHKHCEGENARHFMDKIVQVTFNLPQLEEGDFGAFLQSIDSAAVERIGPHMPVIVATVQRNPRRFKRFLNDLALMEGLHRNKETGVEYNDLLYWKLLEFESPELVEQVRENAAIFAVLLDLIGQHAAIDATTGRHAVSREKLEGIAEKSLVPFLQNGLLVNLIHQSKLTVQKVRAMLSLVGIVETEQIEEGAETCEMAGPEDKGPIAPKMRARSRRESAKRMHPAEATGIEMAGIPSGSFLYDDDKKPSQIEAPFEIDIYPVTNRRYDEFVAANIYESDDEAIWTEEGLKWRKKEGVHWPAFWDDEKWNQPDHPVVGVSWYEAVAYCNWLNKTRAQGYAYQLPTDEQWERAARGTNGREYPWGDEFDKERCNTEESGIGRTTRVTRYPNGISPEGCYDMAGNVWEWTSSKAGSGYSLRGGSWVLPRDLARCAARYWGIPGLHNNYVGFRCARTQN